MLYKPDHSNHQHHQVLTDLTEWLLRTTPRDLISLLHPNHAYCFYALSLLPNTWLLFSQRGKGELAINSTPPLPTLKYYDLAVANTVSDDSHC